MSANAIMTTMGRVLVVALLFALIAPARARADSDTHYQDTLIGDRAAGMGGAFTALANEATGAYYNPAGIVVDESTLIQLSMSAYKWRSKRLVVIDVCGAEITEDEGGLFGFPASVGFVKPFTAAQMRHAIGFSLTVPFATKASHAYSVEKHRCGQSEVNVNGSELLVDRTFVGAATYALRPVPWLQLGASFGFWARGATQTSLRLTASKTVGTKGDGVGLTFVNADVSVWTLFAQLGAIVEPLDGLHIGLSFTTPQLRVAGRGRLDVLVRGVDANDKPVVIENTLDDAEYYSKIPFVIALGGAYRIGQRWTVALDVKVHGPVAPFSLFEHPGLFAGIDSRNERRAVVNVNVGAEVQVIKRLALRAGFFTNFTSYPDVVPDQIDTYDHIDLFGLSLGASFKSSKASVLSLALQGQFGSGQSTQTVYAETKNPQAPVSEAEIVSDAREISIVIAFGGSVDLR